jgi:hypothetical protein
MIPAGITSPAVRRSIRLVAALGVFGVASVAVAGALYVTIVLPRSIEWSQAFFTAQDAVFDRFIRGERSMARVHAVVEHRRDCFPTESAWLWARLRESAVQVEVQSRSDYMLCLENAANEAEKEAEKVHGWRPPRPQI